ncbi:MAG: hypothetical protein KDJ88_06585 [Bauldia sp.]|nr:hypothetical protein [Bauldia sp.]
MLQSKTLFVVGAGASQEADLPTGEELKLRIGNKTNISFKDGRTQVSGSEKIVDALRIYSKERKDRNINDYFAAGRSIAASMSLAPSIDSYIEAHKGNEYIELCAKLAIVETILESEKASKLKANIRSVANIFSKMSESWYTKIFRLLAAKTNRENVNNALDNVEFIIFNYDRCVEQFFLHALREYYGIQNELADKVVQGCSIIHPYGTVGDLSRHSPNGIEFGSDVTGAEMLNLSSHIRTFGEQYDDKETLNNIRKNVREAETIVFLGFSFQKMNMDLLDSIMPAHAKRIYATACGISSPDCEAVETDIVSALRLTGNMPQMVIRNDLKCAGLFDEYSRVLGSHVAGEH